MAWDSVPWFVGGGAEHSPEVARLLAYAAVGGAEGIVTPGDLKVSQLNVPGTSVNIADGAGLIPNRAAGGSQQTYVGRMATQDTIAIASTGSSGGRNDMVIARVEDPYMAGEVWPVPTNPKVGPYVRTRVLSNVPASAIASPDAAVAHLRANGFSAIPLAGIKLPASTGTVTSSMIVDLRKLARPRRELNVFRFQPSSDQAIPEDTYAWFPQWEPLFTVPEWATHFTAVLTASGIYKLTGAHIIGDLQLAWSASGGASPVIFGNTVFEIEAGSSPSREVIVVSGETDISASHRGQVRTVRVNGRRNSTYSQGTRGQGSEVWSNKGSNFTLLIEFEERAI